MVRERPAPLVLVPAVAAPDAAFGSYTAVAETGRSLLGAELTGRLGRLGAAVEELPPPAQRGDGADTAFHWGRWFASGASAAIAAARADGRSLDAIGYAGPGALALLDDDALDALLSPVPGEVVANNRFSADAFVVAASEPREAPDGTVAIGPGLDRALERLDACPSDNTAPRCLESVGFAVRDLAAHPGARFDVDTPLDLALLRLATRLPKRRHPHQQVAGFLEMARLPGGRELEVPHLAAVGEVLRSRTGQLVVAGRVPAGALRLLESEAACRVRAFVEERGMRAARDLRPRSLLARWIEERGAGALVRELAELGDAVILDSRVLMAAIARSSDAGAWPGAEERFASDFADPGPIRTAWLRELVDAVRGTDVPFLLGGHALVSDGLRLIVEAAWLGR